MMAEEVLVTGEDFKEFKVTMFGFQQKKKFN